MSEDRAHGDRAPDEHWSLLLAELQSSQSESADSGTDMDEMLIARYLAGECDGNERQKVEQAARSDWRVRECLDIAREVLLSQAPQQTKPAAVTTAVPLATVSGNRRNVPAAFLKWAAAASLLMALVAGGAFLARAQRESTDALALVISEMTKLQENQDKIAGQLAPGTLQEIPSKLETVIKHREDQFAELRKQDQLAAKAEVEAIEGKMTQTVLALEATIQGQKEQIALLLKRQDQFAELQKMSAEDLAEEVAALRQAYATRQATTPHENATTVLRPPVEQSSLPPLSTGGHAVPCQPVGPSTALSYPLPVPTSASLSAASGATWRATLQAPSGAHSALSPVPAVRWVAPQTQMVAPPVVEARSLWTPTAPSQPPQGPTVILDDSVWRPVRD